MLILSNQFGAELPINNLAKNAVRLVLQFHTTQLHQSPRSVFIVAIAAGPAVLVLITDSPRRYATKPEAVSCLISALDIPPSGPTTIEYSVAPRSTSLRGSSASGSKRMPWPIGFKSEEPSGP